MRTAETDRILLVDDEPNALTVYSELLREWGLDPVPAGGTIEALELIASGLEPAAAVVDLRMPEPDGMALYRWFRENRPGVPVIIMTAYGSIGSAVEAIREGAFHYVAKPPEPEELRSILDKARSYVAMTREIRALRERLEAAGPGDAGVIGSSPAFGRCLELARAVAGSEAAVLVLGETGTGKELLARFIHGGSRRAGGPFVGINCGALPPQLLESELFGHERGAFTGALASRRGRFEEADGGTVFLDEVGDCSPDLQVKLLRVLQEKEFCRVGSNRPLRSDFRLVAATHRDLAVEVREERFREDLYFRVNVVEIRLPALRERIEDIPALATHFLRASASREKRPVASFSPRVLELLREHDWPGNVRELENVVHRAVILAEGNTVLPEHLPAAIREGRRGAPSDMAGQLGAGRPLSEWERLIIKSTLARCRGNKSRAARLLGISRKVLYAKMDRHRL